MNNNDESIIRDIDRRTLTPINNGFHFKEGGGKEFARMFEEYKSCITEIKSQVNTKGKDWSLLESMASNVDFMTEEPILTMQEYSRRLGIMSELVDKYWNI